ncbi:LysR family transcriptional regulator [Undibacterium sp. TS12]|uniref:LysR family transcriptional regulator n=1 Tax=Undibacterium sp. TS12 TaxID=2908202 RepID=UPI001F4C9A6B|nr:LysR family transcriptional regulator [Undibacterium sp. TS12]MCH8621180.1 LysR substrate-binding domain-containing protein [Undibacterium sp. TS12]
MDIKWIEDFLNLAHTRNFSRSADHRNVTQSALSRRIRALEAWVGTDLIDRSTYPLTLTAAGKMFSESARESLRILDDTRAVLRGQNDEKNILRISAGHTLSLNFLPMWIDSIQKVHGEFKTKIVPANVHESVLSLVEGNCDLLLCYHHHSLPIDLDPDRYEYISLGTENVIPVSIPGRDGGPAFSLPGSKSKPVPRLKYSSVSFFGRVVDLIQLKTEQKSYFVDTYESDMAELLKKMALAGRGIAWLPESCIVKELAEGKLIWAGSERWSLTIDIRLFRAIEGQNPLLNDIWKTLTNQIKKR